MSLAGVVFPEPLFPWRSSPRAPRPGQAEPRLDAHHGGGPEPPFSRNSGHGRGAADGLRGRARRPGGAEGATQVRGEPGAPNPQGAVQGDISKVTTVDQRYKQQSGGHGHFAHAMLRLEPMDRGGGSGVRGAGRGRQLAQGVHPPVEKGVRRACTEGVLAASLWWTSRRCCTTGATTRWTRRPMDFDICGYFAFKKAFGEATPGCWSRSCWCR